MALVNILAKSDVKINWDELLGRYTDFGLINVEIFPIPMELGFEQDSIGINVSSGYSNKETAINELKLAINLFTQYNLEFVELYDGIAISTENITTTANKLLGK